MTNADTTGRTGVCEHCGATIEEGLLLKGLVLNRLDPPDVPRRISPGVPVWRTLDRGPGCAQCTASPSQRHEPDPGTIRSGEQRAGIAFGL